MPDHIVKQGEHLCRVADDAGFADPLSVWNASENADLRKTRPNPDVLMPGDKLFLPERETKHESAANEKKHRFRLHGCTLILKIKLLGFDGRPLIDTPCELHIDGQMHPLTSDGNGLIEHPIPKPSEDARLVFNDPDVPFELSIPIKIGHLDPIDERSGQKARLANLGYLINDDAEDDANNDNEDDDNDEADIPQELSRAIEEFQCEHGLTVDGICGPKTQGKLAEIHGS